MQTFYETVIANNSPAAETAWAGRAASLSLEQARAMNGTLADWQTWSSEVAF